MQLPAPGTIFPTKAIRIINLAPRLPNDQSASGPENADAPKEGDQENPYENNPAPQDFFTSQSGLLQLIRMLGNHLGADIEHHDHHVGEYLFAEDSGDEDEWEDEEDDEEEAAD